MDLGDGGLRAALRLIAAMEAEKTDLTTDYRSGNLLTVDNPAVTWLRTRQRSAPRLRS